MLSGASDSGATSASCPPDGSPYWSRRGTGSARAMADKAASVHTCVMAETRWSIDELQQELRRFEREARAAGLKESSVHTYVDRSERFVRWLAGEFTFQGGR